MHEWLEALILGIVQGLTEFLPVSSSGHLEIAKYILGDDSLGQQSLLMTITLHAATALATIVVYKKDVKKLAKGTMQRQRPEIAYAIKIILSMIPAVLIGLLLEKEIEGLFDRNMTLVASMLVVTGIILLLSELLNRGSRPLTNADALLIGVAQAIAIMPGISRSGATIGVALLLGKNKSEAARFSFLMVIPLIFGKMIKEIIDGDFTHVNMNVLPLIVGFLAAFFTGWLACKWIISIVRNSKLRYFAIYCFVVAMLLWIL